MTSNAAAAVAALQQALAAEQAAAYGYGVVGSHLTFGSAAAAAASADWVAHQRIGSELTEMISARGGQPVAAAVAYQLPFPVTSPTTAQQLAATMEDRVAEAYLVVVGLPERGLRSFGAQQVRAAALRAEAWRGTTEAFPGMSAGSLRR
jgi:hypothetical protein